MKKERKPHRLGIGRETFCSSQRVEDRHENIRGEKMKRRQKKESTV